ncbi:DUF4238 domain-containing protein [Candidatus Margulisiibacteriota bacterium]
MTNRLSKKHHYLPRFYLKGFANSTNGFFVYDKQLDKFFETSPDSFFFSNNLNTITYPDGNDSDFLEKIYADIEKKSATSFKNIRNSSYKISINHLDKMNLFFFLLFQHWRLPSNILFVEKIEKNIFKDNSELDYIKIISETDKSVPEKFINTLRSSKEFNLIVKTAAPFAPFFKDKNWANKLKNWKFLYTEDNTSWYMVGDNPIITHGFNDHDPVNCLNEFMFPVSGNVLLVNNCEQVKKELSPEFVIQFNVSIIQKAKRFAACQNKCFLEAMVKDYKLHAKYEKTKEIIPALFKMVKD